MRIGVCSRRTVVALTGALLTSGCTSSLHFRTAERQPVLVSLAVANDTDREHEYRVRVHFAAGDGAPSETVFRAEGTLQARERTSLESDWPKEPGQYTVEVSVDGGNWLTRDLSERFTQEERICYAQEISIGADDARFLTDVNAPCPP